MKSEPTTRIHVSPSSGTSPAPAPAPAPSLASQVVSELQAGAPARCSSVTQGASALHTGVCTDTQARTCTCTRTHLHAHTTHTGAHARLHTRTHTLVHTHNHTHTQAHTQTTLCGHFPSLCYHFKHSIVFSYYAGLSHSARTGVL